MAHIFFDRKIKIRRIWIWAYFFFYSFSQKLLLGKNAGSWAWALLPCLRCLLLLVSPASCLRPSICMMLVCFIICTSLDSERLTHTRTGVVGTPGATATSSNIYIYIYTGKFLIYGGAADRI